MTLNWKKMRLYLLVFLVLASRSALERLIPGTSSGHIILISFWLLLGLPLLTISVIGLYRDRRGTSAATVR